MHMAQACCPPRPPAGLASPSCAWAGRSNLRSVAAAGSEVSGALMRSFIAVATHTHCLEAACRASLPTSYPPLAHHIGPQLPLSQLHHEPPNTRTQGIGVLESHPVPDADRPGHALEQLRCPMAPAQLLVQHSRAGRTVAEAACHRGCTRVCVLPSRHLMDEVREGHINVLCVRG